eukprot:gene2168-25397_t
MSQSSQSQSPSQSQSQSQVLFAIYEDVKPLINLLRAINFAEGQEATFEVQDTGIKMLVDKSKSMQAKVMLSAGLFSEYRFDADEMQGFNINIGHMLECLGIFGGDGTTMRLSYAGYGSPLVMNLEEGGVVTDCNIRTMEADVPTEIDIRATEIPANIIMKSHWLAEVFAELDSTSELVKIQLSPDQPYFRISTDGDVGTSQVECPKESDVVESFTCSQQLINRYLMNLIKPSEKALSLSKKISIRMNGWGTLSIQYLVPVDETQSIFIEFLCLPADDDADDSM